MTARAWVAGAMPAVVAWLWTLAVVGAAFAAMVDAPQWTRRAGALALLAAVCGLMAASLAARVERRAVGL